MELASIGGRYLSPLPTANDSKRDDLAHECVQMEEVDIHLVALNSRVIWDCCEGFFAQVTSQCDSR